MLEIKLISVIVECQSTDSVSEIYYIYLDISFEQPNAELHFTIFKET